MKIKSFFLIILLSNYVLAQYNFNIDENNLISWEYTFETDNIENLQNHLSSKKFTSNLILKNNTTTGISNEKNCDSESLRLKFRDGPMVAFITIDIKENKYTVRVNEITFLEYSFNLNVNGTPLRQVMKEITLEKHVLDKKTKYRTFRNKRLQTDTMTKLNDFFLKTFSMNN